MEDFYIGDWVKVPHMVDAYGTITIVPGRIARIYRTFIAVDLVGAHTGYTVCVNGRDIKSINEV